MVIAIIGAGAWGTALAQVLADHGHEGVLLGRDASIVDEINQAHQNRRYFGADIFIDPAVKASLDWSLIKRAEALVFAVPTAALKTVAEHAATYIEHTPLIINTAKGLNPEDGGRLSELLRRAIPEAKRRGIATLIGPSHAEEVILRKLTLISSTANDLAVAEEVARLFSVDYFRVYAQTDEIGAEIGSAMKNVIAIASGILNGLGYGDNTRAALITRGLAEMVRFGTHFGAKPETFQGLTGLGDLSVTCNSPWSRNFQAGFDIGSHDSPEHFYATNINTVEGILACRVIRDIGRKAQLDLPITEAVYVVLYENRRPSEMIRALMTRPLRHE